MGNSAILTEKFEWIREFWQYRELFYFFVWRDIKVRYKQTVLGALWAVIQPFCSMIVFTIFFGKFAKMPSEGVPYPVFSYAALVPWTLFSVAVGNSGNSLVGNSNLFTKVYFPRVAIPASAALAGLIDFFVASIILFGIMIYFHMPLTWYLIFWPFLTIPLIIMALGLGMFFSSLNVKYRDIKYAIPFVIQMLFFVTPIIYPISILPEKYQKYAALNPMTGIIEGFRAIAIHDKKFNLSWLIISVAISVIIFLLGLAYFRHTEKEFSDIV